MAELLDFMVVRSDRSEAVAKYTVLYRPADYFCKRLNFEFDNPEEAEAVAFYFQYWMNAGGRVRYTVAPDIPGVLMSMDGSDMTDCPMDLSKQLYCLFSSGGYCPLPLVEYLLNLQPRCLDYLFTQHAISFKAAGKIKLVRLSDINSLFRFSETKKRYKEDLAVFHEKVVGLRCEYNRMSLLLPALRQIGELANAHAKDERNNRILLDYIEGKENAELAANWNLSPERIRQILVEQVNALCYQISQIMVVHSSILEERARNIRMEHELVRLRAEAKLTLAGNLFNVKPDKKKWEWIKDICRLYSTPISEMGFSTRTYNVLTHLGVQDIFGLSKLDETTLHHAQNSGKKTVHEVMEFKEQFNLKMLSDPIYMQYVEWLAHKLSEQERDCLGEWIVSMDSEGNVWTKNCRSELDLSKVDLFIHPDVVETSILHICFPELGNFRQTGTTEVQTPNSNKRK